MRANVRSIRKRSFTIVGGCVTAAVAWNSLPTALCPKPVSLAYSLERSWLDFEFAVRGPRRADPRVVIVGFNSASEQMLGTWPVSRHSIAKAVKNLSADNAKLIILDILFEGPSDPAADTALELVLAQRSNVLTAARFDRDPGQHSHHKSLLIPSVTPGTDLATFSGLVEVSPDEDGVIRRFVPYGWQFGEMIPSLALQGAALVDGGAIELKRNALGVGKMQIPLGWPESVDPVDKSLIPSTFVDFNGGANTFPMICDLGDLVAGKFPRGSFTDKIVFVGITGHQITKEFGDSFVLSSTSQRAELFGGGLTRRVPGVVVQAHFLNAILSQSWLVPVSPVWSALLGLAMSLAMSTIAHHFLNWKGLVGAVGVGAGALAITYVAFAGFAHIVPLASATLAALAFAVSGAWVDRAAMRDRWSRYVSPRVFEIILASGEDIGAVRCRATVMFIDVRGFTEFAHRTPAAETLTALNKHFERILPILEAEDATIDKFMGDGILCIFGAPHEQVDAPIRAARAAKALQCIDSGFPFAIGVATGEVVVGHVGTTKRHDFSVIGNAANLASRIQAVSLSNQTVIDQATAIALAGQFETRLIGEFEFKGIEGSVAIFELL